MQRVDNKKKYVKRSAESSSDEVTPKTKRIRVANSAKPHLMKRYPIHLMDQERLSTEDYEEAERVLQEEWEKPDPDPEVYLPLMKSTFEIRRQYVVSEAESARDIMEKHPLKRESVVRVMCFVQKIMLTLTFACSLIKSWN